jgi:hypothetical protein
MFSWLNRQQRNFDELKGHGLARAQTRAAPAFELIISEAFVVKGVHTLVQRLRLEAVSMNQLVIVRLHNQRRPILFCAAGTRFTYHSTSVTSMSIFISFILLHKHAL